MTRFKRALVCLLLVLTVVIPIGITAYAAEATGTVDVTVTANTPTVTANNINVTYTGSAVPASKITGTAYNSWHNNDANWKVAGTWSWVDAAPTNAGTYTKKVKFTPTDTTNYNAVEKTITVTIAKANPTVSNLKATTITYGSALSSSSISATVKGVTGADLAGGWAWVQPTTKPNAGTPSYDVKFTPTDTTNYNTVTRSVSLTVNKANQSLSIGSNLTVTYGTANATLTVTGTKAGTPTWSSSNTNVATVANGVITYKNVGSSTITCVYPGNTNYNSITKTITVTVNKATPTLTAGTATAITYGQTLASSTITAGTAKNPNNSATVAGKWAWTNSATKPNAGTQSCSVTFTPTDTTNYNTATVNYSVKVNKASQSPFGTFTDLTKTYGDAAYSASFTGQGTFTVASSNTAVATVTKTAEGKFTITIVGAGSTNITCTFAGNTNYNSATATKTLTVKKNTPTITVSHDNNQYYGKKLSALNLKLTKNVNSVNTSMTCAGTVSFDNPNTILTTGTHTVGWTFTPSNTTNYNKVTGTTSITVKKMPILTLPAEDLIEFDSSLSATSIVQGEPLSYSTISGSVRNMLSGSTVAGTWRWADTSTIPQFSDSNTTPYNVIFTPTDTTNYSVMTSACTVSVDQRTPIISNVSYSIARAGNTLSSLNVASTGTDPITLVGTDGETMWDEDETMTAGTHLYNIAYCADDTELYQTAYTAVAVSVEEKLDNPITTRLDYYTAKYSPNGTFNLDADAHTTLKYTSNNPDLFTVSNDGTVTILSRGEGSITISALEDATYSANNKIVNVLIEKGDYNPTVTASNIKYGQPISASVLTTTNGSAKWVSTLNTATILTPGEYQYKATWVPADSNLYNPAEVDVTLVVEKATVVPSLNPFTANLYYNQNVVSNEAAYTFTSTVTGQVVTGTFSYTSTESICKTIGTSYCNYTFMANPAGCYELYTGKIKVTGIQQTPDVVINPVNSVYGKTLSELIPDVHAYDVVTGDEIPVNVAWEDPSFKPVVGTNNCTITVTPVDATRYATKEYNCPVIVTQFTATLTDVAAHDIQYGQTLADSDIAYYSNVDGEIRWDVPATSPSVGVKEYPATFYPTDNVNYAQVSLNIQVTTNKSAPKITTASITNLTYGQKLSELPITYTCKNPYTDVLVKGTWRWETPDVIPTVAPQSFTAVFTPNDTVNYSVVSTQITAPVVKANPVVTITASPIAFGDNLSTSNLTVVGTSGVAVWEFPSTVPTVSDSENTEFNVIFKPSDTSNYNTINVPTRVKVSKAIPQVSDITATGIVYGQRLADSTLSYTNSVEGTLVWKDVSIVPSVADAGITQYDCVFTPKDIDNYEIVTMGVTLDVAKYIPRITTNDVRTATYGEKLSDIALTYTANNHYLGCNVPGVWTWEYPDKLPTVATQTYSAIFTPKDTVNYAVTSIGVQVNVVKGDPKFTLTTEPVKYGVPLKNIPITVNGAAGIATWVDGDITPGVLDSDKTEYSVLFVPDDQANYNNVTTTLTVTVERVNVADIVPYLDILETEVVEYGVTLADVDILNVDKLNIPGTVVWKDLSIVPTATNNNKVGYTAIYTPDDLVNYTASTIELMVEVKPGETTYNNLVASELTYGQTLADSTISAVTNIGGTWTFDEPSHIPTVTEYENDTLYDVTFTPIDPGNYKTVHATVKVKVNTAAPIWHSDIVHSIKASGITYGQELSASTITGETPVPGYYEWMRPTAKPTVADSDLTTFPVRFVSTDPNYKNYEGLSCSVHVAPYAYSPDDFTGMSATTITYGQTLREATINGTSPINGKFVWEDGSIKPSVSDSGETEYMVAFMPKDSVNYTSVHNIPVVITVTKTNVVFSNTELSTIQTTPIQYPNPLSASTITGVTNIPGTFAWENGDIIPNVRESGKKGFTAIFTPTDINYNPKSITLYVEVTASEIKPEDITDIKVEPLVYGDTLGDSKITGKAPVAGHFEWKDPAVVPSVADSGKTKYEIVFIPDDENYGKVATITMTIEVSKAVPEFTDKDKTSIAGASIVYGQKLSASAITGNMPVAGKFEWVTPDVIPTVKDSGTTGYSVRFVPDSSNYSVVEDLTARITVTRKQFTAEDFADIKASAIEYGDALRTSTITATTPVDGKFTWNKPDYTPIRNDSNKTEFAVTFTPTDTSNYFTVSLTCKVEIKDRVLEFNDDIVHSITASRITYGQYLSDSKITGKTPCSGHYEWVDSNIKPSVSDSGVTKYRVRFVSSDALYNDYDNLYATIEVDRYTVSAKDIKDITATSITVGQSLSDSILTGAMSIPGKLTWENPSIKPTTADSNKTKYNIVFTPNDTINYTTFTGLTASLPVGQVTPNITGITLKASDIAFGQTLSESAISGKLPTNPATGKEIPGQYTWVNGTIKPEVADSSITAYKVVFIPTDMVNYRKSSETSLKLNVVRNDPVLSAKDITTTFGASDLTLSISSNSGGAVTYSTTDTSILSISGNTAKIVGVGTATVTAKVSQTSSYNSGTVKFQIVVNAKNTRISGRTAYTVDFGTPAFYLDAKADIPSIPLTYTVSSGASVKVNNEGMVTPIKDGTSVITVSAQSNGYSMGEFKVTVTVNRIAASITTLGNINKVYGDKPFKLEATTNSTMPLEFKSSNSNVITIDGNMATVVGVGQATILVSCAPGGGYESASTTFYVNVVKGVPTVSKVDDIEGEIDGTPVQISDGIDSDGDRTYSSSNPRVASVDRSGTITFLQEGSCEIKVFASATSTMEEAMQVIRVNVSEPEDDEDETDETDEDDTDETDETDEDDDDSDETDDDSDTDETDDKSDTDEPYDPDDIDDDGIPNGEDDDMDGDGIPNDEDDDIDGDGIPNDIDPNPTIPDWFDPDKDTDGDGIPDIDDDDIDGDGIPNDLDDDIDGDGILNEDDPDYWALKAYLDGLKFTLEGADSNGDGLLDTPTNNDTPNDDNTSTPDTPTPIIPLALAGAGVLLAGGGTATALVIRKRRRK